MKKYFLLLLSISFLFSCVPSKDLIYLQGKPIQKKEIKRINDIPYKLQVDDMLNIDIKSSDEEMVSIFKKQTMGNYSGRSSGSNSGGNSGGNSGQNFGSGSGYFSDYSIDSYGNIRMPTLGEINVLGYTTVEVRKKIENELNRYLKNKEDIFVSVKLSGIKYTIIGEIADPGPKVIFQNKVSVIDAIANSGDITIVGNRKKVEIIRNSISGTEKFTIDLTNINAFNSDVFYIKPNDIINIVPLKQKSWGTGTTGLQTFTTIISVFTLLTSTFVLARNL
ncbi:polysaccharide biosynthesis/export family protein [Polaribacter sp. Hel1_85]|uniref:polysaccharide biosynthesis/export family protein n=1 Tax=Polaribacter sp. Hel1_85 TaxID=1250005 RepID=UPI00052BF26E|nr:polysaccharide biosynthesis/export family protein [Polaribacter sp. Hel1_85]KGL63776.1 polysaccharide export outer membrane protein [Polaribacter sp. Hel1_85]